MTDEQDYQDYLDYQKHLAEQQVGPSRVAGIPNKDLTNPMAISHPEVLQNIMSGIGGKALGEVAAPGLAKLLKPIGAAMRKGGDVLMQKAIGAPKIIPGFGEQMAEQGLMGTKAGMQGQATKGLESSGQKISELSSQIPGKIPQDEVANKIASLANSKMTPSGFVRPEDQPVVNRLLGKAEDFAKSEPLSGAEMASRRALAGRSAREAGAYKTQPSQQIKSKVASAEQAGYSESLKKAYRDAFPDNSEALADADKQYSVLSQAKQIMDKPQAVGGLKDFLSQYTPTSLMESIGGRASIGAGKGIQSSSKILAPAGLKKMLTPKDEQKAKSE